MISQSTFIEYLTVTPEVQALTFSHIGPLGANVEQWVVSLAVKSESEQLAQIEKTLSELILMELSEPLRLKLMQPVFVAVERLIAQQHKHYKYETGVLSANHLAAVKQVKSLYYMCILVFNGVIERLRTERMAQSTKESTHWSRLRLLPATKASANSLTLAIYWSILCYQKLLLEFAIAYQRLPSIFWQQLNRLYLLAVTEDITRVDVSRHPMARTATNIHQIYTQICLFSLPNLSAYRRQDITGIHRLLPKWTRYLKMALVPQSKTRLFVNLQGDKGPEYLTPHTTINPYDDQHTCLFIELVPLLEFLENPERFNVATKDLDVYEKRLIKKTLATLEQQYLKPQRRASPRIDVNYNAILLTEFNRIHYHIAGKQSLGNLINQKDISNRHLPKYTTRPKLGSEDIAIKAQLLDQSLTGYRFHTSHAVDKIIDESLVVAKEEPIRQPLSLANDPQSWLIASRAVADKPVPDMQASLPTLQVMSLFAIQNELEQDKKKWKLGIVRWIEAVEDELEVGAQLLGVSITACGVRLDSNDDRSQDFVAALLIAGSDSLNTKPTLMLPRYHFKEGDRVILRIHDKQTQLTLQKNVLNSDDVDQYEIARVASRF